MSAFIDLLKNKTISFIELESILNLFKQACALVDQNNEIVLVNGKLIELTTFTNQEIIQTTIPSIVIEERGSDGTISQKLIRKNRPPMEVRIKKEFLDDRQHWKLYTFLPKTEVDIGYYEELQSFLSSYSKLIEISNKNYDEFCEQGIEILNQVFHFDIIGIYQRKDAEYQLSSTLKNTNDHLPNKISDLEIQNIPDFSVWQQGSRTVNIIQRNAREQAFNTLLIQKLSTSKGVNGILVAGWKDIKKEEALINIVEKYIQLFEFGFNLHEEKMAHQIVNDQNVTQERIIKILIENIQEGVILVDKDRKILKVNQNMERLLGYSEWECMGLNLDDYLVADQKITSLFENTFQQRNEQIEEKIILHRRDGMEEPVKIRVFPITKEYPSTTFIVLIKSTRDIEAMQNSLKELKHQATLGKSVASFAHEVRNPINNMVMNLQALQGLVDGNETQEEMIAGMIHDCDRLDHLMNSILSYAKPLDNKLKPLQIDLLIQIIIDKWETKLQRNHIELVYQCDENIPKIMGDMRSLEQVFTNLISNAVEAMKSQEIGTLAIKVGAWEKRTIRVSISDNGPGIPEEILKKLFTPFVSFSLQGTGLGLAITKEIVAAHKGEINVESFPGGTVFHVILPVVEGE